MRCGGDFGSGILWREPLCLDLRMSLLFTLSWRAPCSAMMSGRSWLTLNTGALFWASMINRLSDSAAGSVSGT